jgi:phenylpyruvate tautomerase PptA (4-oxalocrotonate tautomerase family)
MPCLEITVPKLDNETRKCLAANLTDAFALASGFPADIFGIRFFEYSIGEASNGGNLWDGENGVPYLHFLLYCPRIKRSVKQKLVSAFTTAYSESIGHPDWEPVIHICEHPYDNVGVSGELLSDSYDELAERPFYFDLSED